MAQHELSKYTRRYPVSTRISASCGSFALFPRPNILLCIGIPPHTPLRSCLEELHFLDILTAPEEQCLTAFRQSLLEAVIKMSQGGHTDNSANVGDPEGYPPRYQYSAAGKGTAVRLRGSSDDPSTYEPAEKRRALNQPGGEMPHSMLMSTGQEMTPDMNMSTAPENFHAPTPIVSSTIPIPSTPRPGAALQASLHSFDPTLYHLLNAGISQLSGSPRMSWSSPVPSGPSSPCQEYSQIPFDTLLAEMGSQALLSGNATTPLGFQSISSPFTSRSPNPSNSFVANFPSFMLGMNRSSGTTTSGTLSDSGTISPSVRAHDHSQNSILRAANSASASPTPAPTTREASKSVPALSFPPIHSIYVKWEDNKIIWFWAHPDSSIERISRSMAAGVSPRNKERLDGEWVKLSCDEFQGRRTPTSLASRWVVLIMEYFTLRNLAWSAEPGADNSGQAIAARIMEHVQSMHAHDKVAGNMKASDAIKWCSDMDQGWFVVMHAQFQDFTSPVSGSKEGWPPRYLPMASQSRHTPSLHSSSSASHPAYAPTPPPPPSLSQGHSVVGSGAGILPHHSHVTHGVPHPGATIGSQPHALHFNTMASRWEMTRDNHAVAESQMGVLTSKEEYLKGQTLLCYVSAMRQLMEMQLRLIEFRSTWILNMFQVPMTPGFLEEAQATLRQLHLIDPALVDYNSLLTQLEDEMKRRGMLPT
ncbi:hypothetical protein RhiJN_13148 [Ceratobasidium sp. AG-Ba]|nr:hypothetical protein RhiJN_13148 [Ceratobasidium sp. AG-Ba]